MLTFLDFFSGIGGFRKGFELSGMRCIGHCEIDKYADRSYRAIFDVKEDEWYRNDITKIDPAELPRANLWAGGFPCQNISVAGKQDGLNGERSGLFFEIVRLLEGTAPEDRPEWLVLENVKNLLSVNRGFDLATILYSLASLGYCIEYGLCNSKLFGVPQHRERIYIVAYRHLGAGGSRKVFPVTAGSGKALIQLIGGMQGQRVYDPSGVSVTLAAESGGWGGKSGLYFIDLNKNSTLTDTARCLKARYNAGFTNRSADNSGVFYGCAAVLTPERDKRQNGRRFKDCGEPAFTVTAQDKHGVMLSDCENCPLIHRQGKPPSLCGRIRRLTPRECWRLQGFDDEMFDKAQVVNSDNQLYRQAGNSVTIPVVYAVGQRIVEAQRVYESVR